MDIIFYINGDPNSEGKTKYVINFFGILGCIKVNARGKEVPKKQEGKFNVVEYYFDYPYFSEIVNPEHFEKELKDREKRFTRIIISLWLCSAILSTTSTVLLYLAYSNQKSKNVLAGLATASVVLSIIAFVFFVAGLLWIFFDFVKEKLVVHRIKGLLKDELSDDWIKRFKNELVGKKSEINEEADDKELEKNKDIEEILQFFLDRKKIPALFKFLTNGEKLVQAGMAMVNERLLAGKHPNDIVVNTNSMGAGIGAEVVRRFEKQGIYLTLIHSNSFSSLSNVANTFKRPFHVKCLNILEKFFGLALNSKEVVEKTKCPVLIVGREGDLVITEHARLAGELDDLVSPEKTFRLNVILKHDPGIQNCRNEKNIHTDHEEHLGCEWDNNGTIEYISYQEMKSQFIAAAGDYLKSYGLNKGFDCEEYKQSYFSESLTGIKLVPLSGVGSSVPSGG